MRHVLTIIYQPSTSISQFTNHHSQFTIPQILFLTLKVFSATGGIEKVCRVMGKALYEYGIEKDICVEIMSMHDQQKQADRNPYFPKRMFSGFAVKKASFIVEAVRTGAKADVVIISHINLLVAGWLAKKLNPKVKVILLAHGIEIWGKLSPYKKKLLTCCNDILCVSRFTAEKIKANQNLPFTNIEVLNNCIDPFLPLPDASFSDALLQKKYSIPNDHFVLMTLTRLSERDRYKGYDCVLESLLLLKKKEHKIKYVLAGGYSHSEKAFIDDLIKKYGLEENVVLTGYIDEDDLTAHFCMADIYVMPSTKEGFGIVFIEAMYYGVPVIAGNQDGSTDALLNGELGLLIEPNNAPAIAEAVEKMMFNKSFYKPNHALLMENFGYDAYKRKLETILNN